MRSPAAKCLSRDCCHISRHMAFANGATLSVVTRSLSLSRRHGLRSGAEGSERAAKKAAELWGF